MPLTSKNRFININNFIKIILLLIVTVGFSQNIPKKEKQLFESFKAYTKLPREISYAHLNKTTLLKGEDLGFTVYILDKNTKKASQSTTNVYCTLENGSGEIIKSSMLLASSGIAFSAFEIDSLFTSGNYTFKAYTNWMKNFDEQNFYVQDIKIIDPDERNDMSTKIINPSFDVQFLPEGGHLVANIQNTIGVIIKDSLGFGIPNISGSVIDKNNIALTEFETNEFGISKFIIIPKDNEYYKVKLRLEDYQKEVNFPRAEVSGINLSITDLGNKIVLTIKSNFFTLPKIQGKNFKLAIHNGIELKVIDIIFSDSPDISKIIGYSTLFPGINIFTLFDENNKPLLERLFFNYEGVPIVKSNDVLTYKIKDSLLITIPYKNIQANQFNNFSISVLPEATISYNSHQSLISSMFLQSYVKGFIEDAKYYFSDITREKKYNLDMLLLTQGWSSYDWTMIFNNPPSAKFEFETGINFIATINSSKSKQFIIYPMANSSTITIDVPENENKFEVKGLLPVDDEKVSVSSIGKRYDAEGAKLYLQFNPSKIPSIKNFTKLLPLKDNTIFDVYSDEPLLFENSEKIEELDLVVINAQKKQNRIEKIKRQENGTVDVLDDIARSSNMDFAAYISSKGYSVYQSGTSLSVKTTRRTTLDPNGGTPLIYLDNMLLSDFSILINYNMSEVDYVVIDKSGLGQGIRGSNGVIKIFTDPKLNFKTIDSNVSQPFDIPLTFSESKKFYVPIYPSYLSDFFEHFGVVDWIPNGKVDSKGNLSFKIANKSQNFKVFIEGITEDGSFISEIKTISTN